MSARNDNATGRRSWRETPAQVASTPAAVSKWPIRVILALTVISLIGCFVWLLWQPTKPEPQTHFVALTTGRGDLLSVSPILFEHETIAPLRDLGDTHNDFVFIDGEESQRSAEISTIESLFHSLKISTDDRLIVYVSAHGVSDDGQAYVLGPGFDVRQTDRNRYRVKDLLAAVSRQPAATKLVVFDCSRLAVLPRVGMVLNEFASLVQQAAHECVDDNLWIVNAASELETSPLGLKKRRSLLGSALVAGLIGGADDNAGKGDADRHVTLAELEEFVKQRCATASVATPIPKFIFCGSQTSSSRRKSPVLLRIYPAAPDEDAEDSAEVANPSNETTEQDSPSEVEPGSESSLADDQETSPNAEQEQPESAIAKNPPEQMPAKKSEGFSPMLQVWQLRDQLQQGQLLQQLAQQLPQQPRPLPADYAPHYWNEINAALVDLHLQSIDPSNTAEISSKIAEYQQGLQRLKTPANAVARASVTEELDRTLQRYQSSDLWKQLSNLPTRYAQATLFMRRKLQRANQYVDWHRTAHSGAGDAGSAISETTADIAQLLVDLSALDRTLTKLEGRSLSSQEEKALWRRQSKIQRQLDTLDQRFASITKFLRKMNTPVIQRRLEALLATPLATANLRAAAIGATATETNKPRENSQPRYVTALGHLRLECLLVRLADPQARWSAQLQAIADNTQTLPAEEDLRLLFRKVGKELQHFYTQLPSRINQGLNTRAPSSEARTLEKLITIMHPRDTSSELSDGMRMAGFITPRLQPPAKVALQNPKQKATLREGRWITLSWPLELENVKVQSAAFKIGKFDQDLLGIRLAGNEDGEDLAPGQVQELPVSELQTHQQVVLKILLRGKISEQSNWQIAIPFVINLRSTNLRTTNLRTTDKKDHLLTGEVQLRIPRPNRIDLMAWCVDPNFPQDPNGETGVTLRPFPNRTTAFRFALANHSDDDKNIRMELFAVPRKADHAWPPGLLLDEKNQPQASLQELLKLSSEELFATPLAAAEMELPADRRQYNVTLKLPSASNESVESAEGDAAGDSESGDATPQKEPQAAPEITYGLVCRLVDLSGKSDDIIKWIEIAILRPTSYLRVDANYDDGRKELRFVARLRNLDGQPGPDMPPQSTENPVIVNFFGDDQVLEAGGEGKTIISSANQRGEIFAKLRGTVSGSHIIGLVVDGYPRSHRWEINFDNGIIRPTPNHTSVKIDWVAMPGVGDEEAGIAPRLYRSRPRLAFPIIDKKVWPMKSVIRQSRVCAFDVSLEARPLQLRLMVDAPRNAFNSVKGDDFLDVGWRVREREPEHRIYSDRSIKCSFAEITKQGELAIRTKVDDFEVSLDAAETINTSRVLQAQLHLQGSEADDDSRIIVFDDKPPTITSAELLDLRNGEVLIGTKNIRANLTVRDLSGVERVEAWVLPEPPAGEEALDPKAAIKYRGLNPELLETYSEQTHRLTRRIPVPEKLGKYFLAIRVSDLSGKKASTLSLREPLYFSVVAPPPPPKPGPVIHDLVGIVMLGNRQAPAGLKVTVKKKPHLSTKTASKGKFILKKIPAGTYTLLVTGMAGSTIASGELEVELTKKSDYQVQIDAVGEMAGTPE